MIVNIGDTVRVSIFALKLHVDFTSSRWKIAAAMGIPKKVIEIDKLNAGGNIYYRLGDVADWLWVHESQLEKRVVLESGESIYVCLSNKRI